MKKRCLECGGGSLVLFEVMRCGGSCGGGGNDCVGVGSVTVGWLVIL